MKTLKLYMLVMSGQGDTYVTLVDKETWDWIGHPKSTIPPAVFAAYLEKRREDGEEGNDLPVITSGSSVNDAALAVAGYKIGKQRAEFINVSSATKFIAKHNIEIVAEWNGYIY